MTSTLKVNTIQDIGGNTIVSSDGTGGFTNNLPAGKSGSFRNLIINGSMDIAQRGTSTASITGTDYHTVDRFKTIIATLGTWTQSQSTDVPTAQGFSKSLKMDCTTADASPASGDSLRITTHLEGQNLQYLKKGTSSAESLTMSFWVKSNKTGTYILELYDLDNTRQISKSYTINSASTWEKKIITIDGDTSGAFDNDNNLSLIVGWFLGAGSNFTSGTLNTSWNSATNANRAVGQVNLADDTANNFWITGVQLEAGTTASDFEFLPIDISKNRCLRYYYLHMSGDNFSFGMGLNYTSTYATQSYPYPVEMRTTPSLDQVSGTNYYNFLRNSGSDNLDDFALNALTNEKYFEIYNSTDISGTAGQAGLFRGNNASAYIAFDAEL